MDLNCISPLTCRLLFSTNTLGNHLKICDNLKKYFFSIYYIIRIQYVIHKTYKIQVNRLLKLLVGPLANSRLLVIKFSGCRKLYGFLTVGVLNASKSELFKGQLYHYCHLQDTTVSHSLLGESKTTLSTN